MLAPCIQIYIKRSFWLITYSDWSNYPKSFDLLKRILDSSMKYEWGKGSIGFWHLKISKAWLCTMSELLSLCLMDWINWFIPKDPDANIPLTFLIFWTVLRGSLDMHSGIAFAMSWNDLLKPKTNLVWFQTFV